MGRAIGLEIFPSVGSGRPFAGPLLFTLSVFGASGLLGTHVFSLEPNGPGFIGVSSTEKEITRVIIGNDEAFESIDNVRFDTSAVVPEPAMMVLLGSGLVALAARRKVRSIR